MVAIKREKNGLEMYCYFDVYLHLDTVHGSFSLQNRTIHYELNRNFNLNRKNN